MRRLGKGYKKHLSSLVEVITYEVSPSMFSWRI